MKKTPIIRIKPMNIPMMKSYDVVGYVENADTYCSSCAIEKTNPIFAGSEWDYQPYCSECGAKISVSVI